MPETGLLRDIQQLTSRIGDLTREEKDLQIKVTALELQLALLDQKVHNTEAKVDRIQSGFSWFLRSIGGITITAIIAFILAGGLKQ